MNYGQCFAPGKACNVYKDTGAWLIDFNWVWQYDCKVVSDGMIQEKPPDTFDNHKSPQQTSLPTLSGDDTTDTARSVNLPPYLLLMATIIAIAFAIYAAQRRYRKNGYTYDRAHLDVEMTDVQGEFD